MLHFECDYNKGAHERILARLVAENNTSYPGYGADVLCEKASDAVRASFRCPEAQVFFLAGGTQTNQLAIDTLLDSCEGVIAAQTGHVSVHEAGAVEYTGHKILQLEDKNGKLEAEALERCIAGFYADANHDHMVFPGMAYISHPTEYGTLYTLAELESLSDVCRRANIPLYLDGARLGYGLSSDETDVTAADIARLTDVFYIGGTKVGALFGEALVFPRHNAPPRFRTKIKQHGAMLAKGWLLGAQFDELFRDGLYFEIGKHAISMAKRLKAAFCEKNYRLFMPFQTNQIFVVLENDRMKELLSEVSFDFWEKLDGEHTVVRFATSWATTTSDIEALIRLL